MKSQPEHHRQGHGETKQPQGREEVRSEATQGHGEGGAERHACSTNRVRSPGAACGGDDAPVAVRCWLRGAHLPGPPRVRPHDGSLRAASTSRSCLKRNETASCSCKAPMLGGGQRMAPQRPGPILAGGSDPTAIVWAWPTFAPPGAAPSCPRPQGHQGRVPGREAPGPALPAQREPS